MTKSLVAGMLIVVAAIFSLPSLGQESYKCKINGSFVYQDRPCQDSGRYSDNLPGNSRGQSSVVLMQESELKEMVLSQLKDPSSAQFRNVRIVGSGLAMCGEVNAKNSYGGYNGFKSFIADSDGVAWQGDGSTPSEKYKQHNRNTFWPKGKYHGCL